MALLDLLIQHRLGRSTRAELRLLGGRFETPHLHKHFHQFRYRTIPQERRGESEEELDELVERGQYQRCYEYVSALPDSERRTPAVNAKLVLQYERQGRYTDAARAANDVDYALGTPGERLIHELQVLGLDIFLHGDFRRVVDKAQATLSAADDIVDEAELATAQYVVARLQLAARWFEGVRETTTLESIVEQLSKAADALERRSTKDALQARLLLAQAQPTVQARIHALADFVEL
ncbi:MAG: hypothetical protein AAF368_19390, partial [Planctomycetota bacterium]